MTSLLKRIICYPIFQSQPIDQVEKYVNIHFSEEDDDGVCISRGVKRAPKRRNEDLTILKMKLDFELEFLENERIYLKIKNQLSVSS